MKTETRTITFGAAAIAVVASFLAGAYMADGYRTPPARTFGVSDSVAAPERPFVETGANRGVARNKPVGDKSIEHPHLFLAHQIAALQLTQ